MTSPPPNPESNASAVESAWLEHHQRVLNIGYRMLSSVTDAEDVAQDAFTRLAETGIDEIDDVLGWLVTVTSRMCIDRMRLHENSRRSYVGPWLPEPIVGGSEDTVGDQITLDDSVRMALLVVLERLTPAERVAFVLHDVFTLPFAEVGEIVGRSPRHVDNWQPEPGAEFRAIRPRHGRRSVARNIERSSNGSPPRAEMAT